MTYYNVAVGCSSSDVTTGALQVEGPASYWSCIVYRLWPLSDKCIWSL